MDTCVVDTMHMLQQCHSYNNNHKRSVQGFGGHSRVHSRVAAHPYTNSMLQQHVAAMTLCNKSLWCNTQQQVQGFSGHLCDEQQHTRIAAQLKRWTCRWGGQGRVISLVLQSTAQTTQGFSGHDV